MAYDTPYVQKENTGSLFKNDKKLSDNHPDYKGSINIDGVEHWVSAWIKTSNAGTKFMSLSTQPKDQPRAPEPRKAPSHDAARARQLAPRDDSNDPPF